MPFSTTKISVRWPQAAGKKNAAPTTSSAIAEGSRRPTEEGDGTGASSEERLSKTSKHTLRSAQRKGLAKSASVPKAGARRDVSVYRPNWAPIAASPAKKMPRSLPSW